MTTAKQTPRKVVERAMATAAKPSANGGATTGAAKKSEPFFRHAWEIVAEKRETLWLIRPIIEASVLAVITGPPSTFKSFIGLDWLMRIALEGQTVVILSGEGAGIDRRIDAWMRTHAPDIELGSLSILIREKPLNLSLIPDMAELRDAISALSSRPVIVMVDTFSKFSAGLDENDNSEVAAYLASLSENIREDFHCTVLLIAHSGHADGKRSRGASTLMANPDAEYIVVRPDAAGSGSRTALRCHLWRMRPQSSTSGGATATALRCHPWCFFPLIPLIGPNRAARTRTKR